MWKTELKFGICGGIALCLYKCIEYLSIVQTIRLDTGIYTGLFGFIIIIAVIMVGVKFLQNSGEENEPYTFLRAFRAGMIIAIFMAVIAAPFMYIYGKYINPKEANQMIEYVLANHAPDSPLFSKDEIQETYKYYTPSNRALHTAEDIILSGFFVSLFSAGMFRRVHNPEVDVTKKKEMPSVIKKLFFVGMLLALLPVLVYISWVLKYENITTLLFDFIIEPINEVVLQAGTAFFSLSALVVNVIVFNKITHYPRRRKATKKWSVLMIIICGLLFFVSLWPIL